MDFLGRPVEMARNPSRIKIKIVGDFPKTPPFLKMTFKLDAVLDIRDDENHLYGA